MSSAVPEIPLGTPDSLRRGLRRGPKGRPTEEAALAEVRALLDPRPPEGHRADLLIEYLHRLNDAWGGLHKAHLVALAREMNLPMAQVHEVASFYHHFELLADGQQPPALTIRVCESLSCELAGARDLLQRVRELVGAEVRVVGAPCIGRCEQAPAALVGQVAVPRATAETVLNTLVAESESVSGVIGAARGVADHIGYAQYRAEGGYGIAAAIVNGEEDPGHVLQVMEASGLRGLGGAGFPAGRKWRIVRDQLAPRLMAVNIDEGEPGTFKDRHYLERDPHRFLEGMLVAAQVAGTEAIYIYLRDEYHDCRVMLQDELAQLVANPPFPLPHIELRRGAGAYICGEESAMIESIEGKRGMPRLRPPYVAQVGLFGRPTLEHNFETLFWVRDILERGADWFAGQGRRGRKGLRSFSVSGRVRSPGVKLAPAGISLRELVEEYCDGMQEGHALYAYLPGGASGGILPAALADLPLDFDTLQPYGCFIGSAAIVVLGDRDRARDAAVNTMRFFAHESCGQCTPCRVGTGKAAQLMEAPRWDNATLEDLNQVMADASICGLGQAAPNPVRCVQKYFPDEIA
ncbi:MAG TPA: NADH-ubiquinone oxidoreductase-F iron-sulfur binding region domain-containing protein [Ramlibacter sp.]